MLTLCRRTGVICQNNPALGRGGGGAPRYSEDTDGQSALPGSPVYPEARIRFFVPPGR